MRLCAIPPAAEAPAAAAAAPRAAESSAAERHPETRGDTARSGTSRAGADAEEGGGEALQQHGGEEHGDGADAGAEAGKGGEEGVFVVCCPEDMDEGDALIVRGPGSNCARARLKTQNISNGVLILAAHTRNDINFCSMRVPFENV